MKKRAVVHGASRDYEAQADDYRSILYFLRRNKQGEEYLKYYNKLKEANTHLCFDATQENRFEVAKSLVLEEKYFAAAYEFMELANEGYCKGACYEYLGDISMKFVNPKAALVFYTRAYEEDPDNFVIAFKKGRVHKILSEDDEAKECFEKVISSTDDKQFLESIVRIYENDIQRNPNKEEAFEVLGLAYQKLGEYQKTYQIFKKAIDLKPDDIFLKYYLANLLYDMKEYKNAIQIYNEILENNPYESQIRIARAKSHIKTGNVNAAVKDYQVVLAIYPESKQAMYGLYTLFWGKKNFNDTIKMFYPLKPNFRPDAKFYNALANALYQKGMTNDAIAIYKKSTAISPKAEFAYVQLFNIYELEGQNKNAYEIAKLGYRNIPNSKEIKRIWADANKQTINRKNSTALTYMEHREYEKAIKIYEQTEPKDAKIYESIANCYKALKNYKEALDNFKKAIALDPNNSDYYYNSALLYLDLNSKKTAIVFLEKAVELDRRNLKARKLLSYLKQQEIDSKLDLAYELFEKKDYKNTLVELTKAENIYPNNPEVYYYKALTYQQLNDKANAYKFFEKTLELDNSYYLSHFYMAQILEAQGKEKAALEEYEKFLGADVKDGKMMRKAQDRVIQLGRKYY